MNISYLAGLAAVVAMASAVSGQMITKDLDGQGSVLFSDFSTAPSVIYKNAQLQSAAGGSVIYESNGTATDPSMTISGETLDMSLYTNFRARWKITNPLDEVNVWRVPVVGGQQFLLDAGTDFVERQSTIPNPSTGVAGFRIDPVKSGTTWTMELDYIYADLGAVVGVEFNHDGDENGASFVNVSGATVSGGILSGTAGSNDPQVTLPGGLALDTDTYKYVEIRMKGASGQRIDLFWNTAAKASVAPAVEMETNADGQWHTYLIDFSGVATWTGPLTVFRLDPVVATGSTFEIDYVRFLEVETPVGEPEPAVRALKLLFVK